MHLYFLKLIFTFSLLCYFSISTIASHIVGGEISYVFIGHNAAQSEVEYEVTLTLYRDPTGIDYKLFANFGIFQQETGGAWKSYQVVRDVPVGQITEVPKDDDPCKLRSLTDEKLESAIYKFNVTLEIGNNNYLIAYQEGYRNYSINNIQGNGDVGSVYDVLITPEALRTGSSSPQFTDLPPIFICAGYELDIDNSATDFDGDEIRYSFCAPAYPGSSTDLPACCGCQEPDPELCLPPFDGVIYVPPYSATSPLGNQNITVDGTTGLITGTPKITGSYVVAVCIEEYRSGILLSETKRDFEFNVVNCSENLVAKVQADEYLTSTTNNPVDSIAYYESCNELDFSFTNLSRDETYIQEYKWQFYDQSNNLIIEEKGFVDLRDLSVTFPEPGLYNGLMILNDGGTCLDTAFLVVNIIPEIEITTAVSYDDCIAGPINVVVSSSNTHSEIDWHCQLGDDYETDSTDFQYRYTTRGNYELTISATDSFGCTNTESNTISWFPYQLLPPDTVRIDSLLCYNDSIYIYNKWVSTAGTYIDYFPSAFSGCDSIVEIYTISFGEQFGITNEDIIICAAEPYFYNEQWLIEPGLYFDTLTSSLSCDSIVSLTLSNYLTQLSSINAVLCVGESLDFGSQTITSPGTYRDISLDINGCDSLTELIVTEVNEKETFIKDGFCEGSNYEYSGNLIATAGTYEYYYSTYSGCDSTVYLELEIYKTYEEDINFTICEGGSYSFGGNILTIEGSYTEVFTTSNNCDSIVTLDLSVTPKSNHEYRDTICVGEIYAFGELNLNIPGLYFDTLVNANGCDSLVVLELEVGKNLSRINVDEELEFKFGEEIILEPEVIGGDLISKEWSEIDEILSYSLELEYIVSDDEWIYFTGTNELFCVALDSVFIKSILEIDIYFPNVISPDGDGINDIFNIGASPTLATSRITIYDRWGNLMYVGPITEDRLITDGWDGRYNDELVQPGTYTYMAEVEFINGESKVYGGEVMVIR